MAWGALAGALAAGRTKFRSTTPNKGRGRRPKPISTGPKTGKRPRQLTTSEAAIRRFEERRRKKAGTGRGPRKPTPTGRGPRKPTPTRRPWGRQGGPRADARPTGGGIRTSGTSRAAIGRSRSRLGRGGRVAGRPVRGTRRR